MTAAGDVLVWFRALCNWGRWGPDDSLGTLNYVTPEIRRRALGLVSDGEVVSCAWDMDAAGDVLRFMTMTGQGIHDAHRVVPDSGLAPSEHADAALSWVGFPVHGGVTTHVDGLSHVFWNGQMYNGLPAELVTTHAGATANSVCAMRDGVVTRGVLIDAAGLRGVDWLQPGEGVGAADLEAAEAAHGVTIGTGDAVLLRTGYGRFVRTSGRRLALDEGCPGWSADALPWLHQRQAALIGCDTPTDMRPSGHEAVGLPLPVHHIGIVAMGLTLIDNCDLEPLAETCRRKQRYDFALVVSPLRLAGCDGSPVNPLAMF